MHLRNTGFTPLEVLNKSKRDASGALSLTGFTLIEVMLASVIGAFVALIAVGALRAISASAEMVNSNTDVAAEVRFASRIIATDLMNLYRDVNVRNTKLVGAVEESDEGVVSLLTFYTVGRAKARIDQPEADVYEVEYYLLKDEEKSVLTRRLWPNPDKDALPGGVLSVIAEDIDVFEVRFFDGEEWQNEWPEELQSIPQLVEVWIAARQPGRSDMIVESFVMNFARSVGGQAGAFESGEQEEGEES